MTIAFRTPAGGAEWVGFAYSPRMEAVLSLYVLVEPNTTPSTRLGACDAQAAVGADAEDRGVLLRGALVLSWVPLSVADPLG